MRKFWTQNYQKMIRNNIVVKVEISIGIDGLQYYCSSIPIFYDKRGE